MTTQTTDVQSTSRAHKSRLEHRSSLFEVPNFLTLSIMGKPKLAVAATILAGAVSASGAQAKEGEQYALLDNEHSDIPTQYEGSGRSKVETISFKEQVEAQIQVLLAQISNAKTTCELLNGFKKKVCINKNTVTPRTKITGLENDLKDFEQAQRIEKKKEIGSELAQTIDKKQDTKSELSQANQKLTKNIDQHKTNVVVLSEKLADEKNKVAALKAIQKVAEEMTE